MKYIDAEKLAKAIEDKGLNCSFALKMERLDTLALIDELQQEQPEEPDKSLEEEMDKFFETMPVLEHENIFEDTFKNIARHFAEWGAEHAKK